jgi:hypothetical protein
MFMTGKNQVKIYPNNDKRSTDFTGLDWYYLMIECDHSIKMRAMITDPKAHLGRVGDNPKSAAAK